MKCFLHIIRLVVLLLPLQCPAAATDSLLRLLQGQRDDSNKVKTWYALGQEYELGKMDSAAYCYRQGYALSKRLNYSLGVLRYYPNITAVLNSQGEYRKSLALNLEGLELSKRSGRDERVAIQLANLANNYLLMQKWDTAISYYTEALRIFDKRHDSLGIANTYSNMAEIYKYNDELVKAVHYADMAAALSKGKNDLIYLNALDNKANLLLDLHRYDEAMKTYAEAESLARSTGNLRVVTNITGAYSDYAFRKGDYKKMLEYALAYVELAAATGSEEFIVRGQYGLAKSYFYNKQYEQAGKYGARAKEMAEQARDVNMQKKIYPLYASIMLMVQGDINTFHRYNTIADSLENATLNSTILKNTQDLDVKYNTEKKEQQLKLQAATLKQNRLWNLALSLSIIAVLLITFISSRSYRNKRRLFIKEQQLQEQRIAVLEQEKQLAASHAVLKGQEEERSRLAKDLHDGLGGLLSSIKFSFGNMKENLVMSPPNQQAFERSMDMLDISIKELRRVAHSMMPESLSKLGLDAALKDMCSQVEQSGITAVTYQGVGLEDAVIEKNVAINVYRIVQELLNNAIKHSGAAHIVVQVTFSDGLFTLTVEDDGRGFDTAKASEGDGMGWGNIKSRVAYLSGSIDLESVMGGGTSVFITFNTDAA